MEEVWLECFLGDDSLIYLVDMLEILVDWFNVDLVEKWVGICKVCCVVMVVLEI